MQLQLMSWPEVEVYLKASNGVIVPIGSTEQHGPNGFIGTDALCPEIVARGVSEKIGALIAPTLSIGMEIAVALSPLPCREAISGGGDQGGGAKRNLAVVFWLMLSWQNPGSVVGRGR